MTPEELKEIEDRARKASPTFALDFMKREDFEYMNRGRSDVYKLLDYIKELESQLPRWIPVEEGLPEEGIWVLGYTRFQEHYAVKWEGTEWLIDAPSGIQERGHKDFITHWRPLPECPEEGK